MGKQAGLAAPWLSSNPQSLRSRLPVVTSFFQHEPIKAGQQDVEIRSWGRGGRWDEGVIGGFSASETERENHMPQKLIRKRERDRQAF